MKRGLILTLLMVAMVALVLPVSARAPIVNPMPTIIIGDLEDAVTSGTDQVGILRFPNAVDLLDPIRINWNNPTDVYTSASYHAYLHNAGGGAPDIKPYDAAGIIELLTEGEYTALLADGTAPAAEARISLPGLSLYDASRHPAIVDPATADPATDGEVIDAYSATATLTFVAAVESAGSGALAADAGSVSALTVLSQSGANDGTEVATEEVANYTFEGSVEGWTFSTLAGFAAPTSVGGTGQTAIGFNLASPVASGLTHGSWESPKTISGSSATAGRVYRAVAQLTSNQANSDTCSGWRLTFRNIGFSHYGKVTMVTEGTQPSGEANTPTTGSPYEARLYWVAPYFLGDMQDGGGQAVNPMEVDARLYSVTFDSIATAGDTGQLMMEEINISSILRPMDMDPVLAWGSAAGQVAYNAAAAAGGWQQVPVFEGFTSAAITRAANNVAMGIGGTTGNRYTGALSAGIDAVTFEPVNQLRPVSNSLYRFSFTVFCSTQARVPTYRCNVNGQAFDFVGMSVGERKMAWAEYIAFSNQVGIGKQAGFIWETQNANVCPGAPSANSAAPTALDVYVWSHNVKQDGSSFISTLYPQLTVVDVGMFSGPSSAWADPTATMTFSDAQWENLGSDW